MRIYISIAFIIICVTHYLPAQWVQTNGPYGGFINCITTNGSNLFAGTNEGGVFLSTNNGNSWTAINAGLTCLDITSLITHENNLFAATNCGGVFLSTNNGLNWLKVDSALIQIDTLAHTPIPTKIVTSVNLKLSKKDSTLKDTVVQENFISTLAISGGIILGGTHGRGIYRSINNVHTGQLPIAD